MGQVVGEVGSPTKGAIISPCGLYRYALWREWDSSLPRAVFVMLNPSTADAEVDDPTIRKCVGFAKRWNCGGIHVVNLFAYRATDPARLVPSRGEGLRGIHGGRYQWDGLYHCSPVKVRGGESGVGPCVVAWGAASSHRKCLREAITASAAAFVELASRIPVPLQCLGRSQDGNPRHPLMLSYATELEPWTAI